MIILCTYVRTDLSNRVTNFLNSRYFLKRINKLKLRNPPNISAYVLATRITSTNKKDKNTTDKIQTYNFLIFEPKPANFICCQELCMYVQLISQTNERETRPKNSQY